MKNCYLLFHQRQSMLRAAFVRVQGRAMSTQNTTCQDSRDNLGGGKGKK
jgi:hypothetical protein